MTFFRGKGERLAGEPPAALKSRTDQCPIKSPLKRQVLQTKLLPLSLSYCRLVAVDS